MELRQVISTGLARATIGVLITQLSSQEPEYCLLLRPRPWGEVEYLESPPPDSPSPPESYLYMKTTPCEILSFTTPIITGYSPDGNLSNYVSYISEISFHTHPSGDLAVIHGHGPLLRL
ncbi:hypothetical protein Acr_23g0016160 [Actinidia rufa]|uniref:Uncharacterized protein n=1 Tax=Actinidia rufa TaxID=165716 RepID=A0A7J0GR22_9ERIC|nr:hypothetical protein Acr_23g0016160 [Actinidia rufa]